jgi:hypothetical protein
MTSRLLADENTSHRLIAACQRLEREFPMVHLVTHDRAWLGLNDDDLLDECLAADLILVAHDQRTLAEAATRAIRERQGHAGIILFRGFIRQNHYGAQARYLTAFWKEAGGWDWMNRMAYMPVTI